MELCETALTDRQTDRQTDSIAYVWLLFLATVIIV